MVAAPVQSGTGREPARPAGTGSRLPSSGGVLSFEKDLSDVQQLVVQHTVGDQPRQTSRGA